MTSQHIWLLCVVRTCAETAVERRITWQSSAAQARFCCSHSASESSDVCSLLFLFKLSKLISPQINCIPYTNIGMFMTVHINMYDTADLRTLSIIVTSLEGASPWTWDVVDWIHAPCIFVSWEKQEVAQESFIKVYYISTTLNPPSKMRSKWVLARHLVSQK